MQKFFSRFELSAPLIYWYLPAGYLATVLAHSYQPELTDQVVKVHLLALIVTTATTLYLWLGVWLGKLIAEFSGQVGFFVILSVGIFRGIGMYYLGNVLAIDSGLSLVNRIVVSWSSTVFWLVLLAYLVNSHREYQANYRLLLSQALINKSAEISEVDLKAQLHQVETSLKSIELNPTAQSDQAKWLIKVADEVKAQINDLIRPMSHRLWLTSVTEYPRIRIKKLIADSILQLNFPLKVFLSLIVVIALFNYTTFMPITEAITRTIIVVGSIAVITNLFNRLAKRSLTTSLIELATLTFIPILLGDIFYSYSHFSIDKPISLVVYLITPFVAVSLSIIALVKQDQVNLIDSIANKLDQFSSAGYQSKQVASYLHNSLQSELLAISKQLEQVAVSEDETRSKEILEQLGALINRSISEDFQNFYASPSQRLQQVIENWRGILTIEITGIEKIAELPAKAVIAVQLIEELASNAVKHSQATQLKISVNIVNHNLVLTVADLGNFSSAGLGSELLRTYLVNDLPTQASKPSSVTELVI